MEIVVGAIVLVMLLVAVDIFATHKYSQRRKNVASKSLRASTRGRRNRVGTYS